MWSELPAELLLTIATKFLSIADFVRFRAICSSWRIAVPISLRSLPREFPWLMLPSTNSNERGFFNHHISCTYRLHFPEASHIRRCAGSSHGWLVLIEESSDVFLINPLTRVKISLPPLSCFPNVVKLSFYSIGREYTLISPENKLYYYSSKEMRDSFIKKVIVSRNPCQELNFIAFAILNKFGDLAYCRNGDGSWKIIDGTRSYCEDVIFCGNSFYAVDKHGSIAICDIRDDDLPPVVRIIDMPQKIEGDMQYLVDAMGELWLVSRYIDFEIDIERYDEVCRTVKFKVFRLQINKRQWEEVTCFDDKVLFVGQNSSFAVIVSDYQGECRGSRIYYTDDYTGAYYNNGYHDVGVYHYNDRIIEPILVCNPQQTLSWPIWITPTLI